jgi:hypothetical protein
MNIPRELQPLINQMTNWQRSQWARAGYPNDAVKRFTRLRRDGTELYRGEPIDSAAAGLLFRMTRMPVKLRAWIDAKTTARRRNAAQRAARKIERRGRKH